MLQMDSVYLDVCFYTDEDDPRTFVVAKYPKYLSVSELMPEKKEVSVLTICIQGSMILQFKEA